MSLFFQRNLLVLVWTVVSCNAVLATDVIRVSETLQGAVRTDSSKTWVGFDLDFYIHNDNPDWADSQVFKLEQEVISYQVPSYVVAGYQHNRAYPFFYSNTSSGGALFNRTAGVLGTSNGTRFKWQSGVQEGDVRQFKIFYQRKIDCFFQNASNDWVLVDSVVLELNYDIHATLSYASGTTAWLKPAEGIPIHFYSGGGAGKYRGNPPGEDDEDCDSCSSCEVGASKAVLDGVHFRIGLGKNEEGRESGIIQLRSSLIDPTNYSPKALGFTAPSGFSAIYDDPGSVNRTPVQFVGPLRIANVVDADPNDESYQLQFFHRNTSAGANPDGTYPASGVSFATLTVKNSDPTGATSNGVTITRDYLGEVEETSYSFDPATDQWQLSRPYDNRIETFVKTVLPNGDEEELSVVTDSNGIELSKIKKTYRVLTVGRRMISRVIDPDGRALTTTREYYDDKSNDGDSYGEVKSVTGPHGHWTRYEYERYDDPADDFRDYIVRPTRTVSQFLDQPISSDDDLNRVVEITVNPAGVPKPSELIVEKLLGQEIARRYVIINHDGQDTVRCQSIGAAWDAADNLVTRVKNATTGEFAGLPTRVENPDGTISLYQRSSNQDGDVLTILSSGAPSVDKLSVVDGTRTETTRSRQGQILSEMTADIASGLVLRTSIASAIDQLGRPTKITYEDGSSVNRTYDCCGLSSETNRFGVTTTYTDSPGVSMTTRLGLTQRQRESGRTTISERIPSGGGAAIEQARTQRNLAGEVISTETTGERISNFVTSTNVEGRMERATILPDTGTRLEVYHPDGNLFRTTGSATFPQRFEYGIGSTAGSATPQQYTAIYVLDAAGADTGEWAKSWTDPAGRIWKQESSSGATNINTYNNKGQLVNTVDADGVSMLYAYDARGRRSHTAVDINQNGIIDFAGPDRITGQTQSVALKNGQIVQKTETSIWRDTGEQVLSAVERSVDGFQSWSSTAGVTSHQQTILDGGGNWSITQSNGDGSQSVQNYLNGRLASEELRKADGTALRSTIYQWDEHGRLGTTTDSRNGTTTMAWYDTDELESITTPAPGIGGGSAQTTSFTYDTLGRNDITTLPDNTQIDSDFFPTGQVKRISGSRTYTREYLYDSFGRQVNLTTNPGSPGEQVTEWTFHPVTGRLQNKKIAGVTSAVYTYTNAGRIETITSARNIITNYGYNSAGLVASFAYSDGETPGVVYSYRRSGDIHTVTRAGATYTYDYGLPGQMEKLSIAGGRLDGAVIDPGYDALHRRDTLFVSPGNGAESVNQSWSYEPGSSRLGGVAQDNHGATYRYEVNSALIKTIDYRKNGISRLTENRIYDNLNRLRSLTALSTAAINAVAKSFTYTYNDGNQRVKVDREDNQMWEFGYDPLGHVETAVKKLADGTPLAGHQFGYSYDSLGNRTTTTFGGDATGTGGFQSKSYTPNSVGDRNQYASITNPGVVLTTGKANVGAAISVNAQPVQDRQGEYFSHQTAVPNETAAQLVEVTVAADDGANVNTVTRRELVPIRDSIQNYDPDGNLIFDGYRDFTWDAENRLLSVQTRADLVPPGGAESKVEYSYDYLSRRIQRRASQKVGDIWEIVEQTRYLYDGWNVIAELGGDPGSPELIQSYLWGSDLSGTAQGAGGVGGLLAIERHVGTNKGIHFVSHDGNGNVVALTNAENGTQSGSYEYDAFGNLLEMGGDFAASNPYRFSTKPQDSITGMYYYGYRYYDSTSGRWVSRDPIEDRGGLNLYGFVRNNGVGDFDVLGLYSWIEYTLDYGALNPLVHLHPETRALYRNYHLNRNAILGEKCSAIDQFRGRNNITQAEIEAFEEDNAAEKVRQDQNLFHQNSEDSRCTQGDSSKFKNHKWVFGLLPGQNDDSVRYRPCEVILRENGCWNNDCDFKSDGTWSFVSDPYVYGTANFGGESITHILRDIIPWYIYGSTADQTNKKDFYGRICMTSPQLCKELDLLSFGAIHFSGNLKNNNAIDFAQLFKEYLLLE